MMAIFRHSFSHCDCVDIADPCLIAQYEGRKCEVFSADSPIDEWPKQVGPSPYRVYIFDPGINLINITIEELELVQ